MNDKLWKCELCSSTDGLDIHNKTFSNGRKTLQRLTLLCKNCYKLHYKKSILINKKLFSIYLNQVKTGYKK